MKDLKSHIKRGGVHVVEHLLTAFIDLTNIWLDYMGPWYLAKIGKFFDIPNMNDTFCDTFCFIMLNLDLKLW